MPQWVTCARRKLPIGVIGYSRWEGTPPSVVPVAEGYARYVKVEHFQIVEPSSHRDKACSFMLLIISESIEAEPGLKARVAPITDNSFFDELCVYDAEELPV